jgi:hypothetical protein
MASNQVATVEPPSKLPAWHQTSKYVARQIFGQARITDDTEKPPINRHDAVRTMTALPGDFRPRSASTEILSEGAASTFATKAETGLVWTHAIVMAIP